MRVAEVLRAPAVAEVTPARPATPTLLRIAAFGVILGGVVVAVLLTAGVAVAAIAAARHGWTGGIDAARDLWRAAVAAPGARQAFVELVTPLVIGGLAVAVALRAGLLNAGAGGQAVAGALAAALVHSALPTPSLLRTAAIVGAALLAGALWALPAALLRGYRGVPELLTTAVLAVIAGGVATAAVRNGRVVLDLSARPVQTWAAVAAVAGALLAGLVLDRGRLGRQLGLLRADRPAAAALGVPVRRRLVQLLVVSGAVAGLLGLPAFGLAAGVTRGFAPLLGVPRGGAGPAAIWLLAVGALAVGLLGRRSMLVLVAGAFAIAVLARAGDAMPAAGVPRVVAPLVAVVLAVTVAVAVELAARGAARLRVRAGQYVVGAPPGERQPAVPVVAGAAAIQPPEAVAKGLPHGARIEGDRRG